MNPPGGNIERRRYTTSRSPITFSPTEWAGGSKLRGVFGAVRLDAMIVIRFPNIDSKRRALGYLAGRYSFTTYKTGEMLVPQAALGELAVQGIQFSVEGPATYGQSIPAVRSAPATPVQ
jgi:hypothetical protein